MLKNKIIGIMLICVISISIPFVFAEDANDTEVEVWAVDEYNGEGVDLLYSVSNALGFASGLVQDGWDDGFGYYDDEALESHWESADDSDYADDVDVAFFAGHGNPNRFYFGIDDDTGAYDFELHYSEASWGGTDMEWAILYACETLASASKSSWNYAFDGLHGICGYDSDVHTDPVTGAAAADEFTSGDSVYDAWVDATMFSGHQDDTAAIYAVTIRMDSVNYDYWDDDLDDPLPDYDGSFVFKYGYTYDSWGCT